MLYPKMTFYNTAALNPANLCGTDRHFEQAINPAHDLDEIRPTITDEERTGILWGKIVLRDQPIKMMALKP
jgi:hypothetical protein